MRFYHAIPANNIEFTVLKPDGYYEDTSRGCPEEVFGSFRISKIPEICFAKSPEGSIVAVGRNLKNIDLYVTNENPDIDLSDCSYDFGVFKEVRYRRSISVKKVKRLNISQPLTKQISMCYPDDSSDNFVDSGNIPEINTYILEYIKKHIRSHISTNPIPPVPKDAMEKYDADGLGMTLGEYRDYFKDQSFRRIKLHKKNTRVTKKKVSKP
jgi:hypothetical protein